VTGLIKRINELSNILNILPGSPQNSPDSNQIAYKWGIMMNIFNKLRKLFIQIKICFFHILFDIILYIKG